jgi:ribosomal-protein-alanine N-acetyltransferase
MVVLGVDTTTRPGSLALVDGSTRLGEKGTGERTHGERLPGAILALLAAAGRGLADVDLFAIVAGPGSFTGLRVGMATVQGLALTAGKRVVPVPTFEAVLAAWLDEAPPDTDIVVPCLDGQRGDVFYAAYDPRREPQAGEPAVLLAPEVGTPDEAARVITARVGASRFVLVGQGAVRYESLFRARLESAIIANVRQPLALAAAVVAAGRPGRAVDPHGVQPIYVRRPDAVLARERARSRPPARRSAVPSQTFDVTEVRTRDDLSEVERLQRESFPQAWGEEALRWELEHHDVARLYLMRSGAGEAVAYCACWMLADELHINSLAVVERWRQQGLARHLLATVVQEAVSGGARSATLEVRESNAAARALYEGFGFRVEGVRRDYYRSPREDALILWHRRLQNA